MLCVNLLLLTCLSIVGIVSAAEPEDWLHTACSGDGVCGPANSQCYEDGCMCAIGFYYSEGSRTCLDYWLHTACSGDGVCGPANSQCYEDGCMCAIGFYYSEGSRTCLDSCTDLDTEGYLMYANATINENIVYSNNGTLNECEQIFSQDTKYLSFEFSEGEPCKFHDVAASVSNWEVAGSYLFQKTCV